MVFSCLRMLWKILLCILYAIHEPSFGNSHVNTHSFIGSPRLGECRILVMRFGHQDVVCSLVVVISFVLQNEHQFGLLVLVAP
jgi:hypothetical protein